MADGGLAYGAVRRKPRWQPAPEDAVLDGLFPDEAEEELLPLRRPADARWADALPSAPPAPPVAPFLKLARSTPAAAAPAMPAPEPVAEPALHGIAAAGLVETAEGLVPAEELVPGDRVITRDRGMQPLIRVTRHAALAAPGAIRVARGALGPGLPARDLLVAPGHRFFLRAAAAEALLGRAEILVAAGDMVGLPGIARAEAAAAAEIEAVQLVCARHELVRVEGLWCETAPGDELAPVRHALPAGAARTLFGL